MSAEHDDLPAPVMQEVRSFNDVNVAWLSRMLVAAGIVDTEASAEARAQAIVASIAGAQLIARSRSDIGLFDSLVATYREAGLLPS